MNNHETTLCVSLCCIYAKYLRRSWSETLPIPFNFVKHKIRCKISWNKAHRFINGKKLRRSWTSETLSIAVNWRDKRQWSWNKALNDTLRFPTTGYFALHRSGEPVAIVDADELTSTTGFDHSPSTLLALPILLIRTCQSLGYTSTQCEWLLHTFSSLRGVDPKLSVPIDIIMLTLHWNPFRLIVERWPKGSFRRELVQPSVMRCAQDRTKRFLLMNTGLPLS